MGFAAKSGSELPLPCEGHILAVLDRAFDFGLRLESGLDCDLALGVDANLVALLILDFPGPAPRPDLRVRV